MTYKYATFIDELTEDEFSKAYNLKKSFLKNLRIKHQIAWMKITDGETHRITIKYNYPSLIFESMLLRELITKTEYTRLMNKIKERRQLANTKNN